eukprot:365909-Chlamydomonas_euryale.AAC.4
MNTIKAPQAWDVYDGRGGTDIPVCVIGDGIDFTHPDLRANMHPDVGYDVTTGDQGEAVSFDQESSSTHHAGTIAGVGNNSIGIAGVAWGGNAKLLGCKLTTDTSESGLAAKFAECLSWCRHQEAWIAYSTHGFDMPVGMLEDAAKAYDAWGGLLVLSSLQRNSNADDNPTYPHQYQLSSVMVVNALNSTSKELLSPSDFGANTTHLFAPGNNIYSTVPNDRYSYLSGPGQGAALVAGAAALLWSHRADLTAEEVKALLLSNVDKQDNLQDKCRSGGVLNVHRALVASRTVDGAGGSARTPGKYVRQLAFQPCSLGTSREGQKTNVTRHGLSRVGRTLLFLGTGGGSRTPGKFHRCWLLRIAVSFHGPCCLMLMQFIWCAVQRPCLSGGYLVVRHVFLVCRAKEVKATVEHGLFQGKVCWHAEASKHRHIRHAQVGCLLILPWHWYVLHSVPKGLHPQLTSTVDHSVEVGKVCRWAKR